MSGLDAFEELCDDLLAQNADLERTKMMGMPSLKRNGKLVAGFVASEGAMVFKLEDPAAHAEALALEGAHLFDPGGRGRPFKEWVVVPLALAERWPALAEKALVPAPGAGKASTSAPGGSVEPTPL
jgi:hypothetical protein